jgi:hypothetical protein
MTEVDISKIKYEDRYECEEYNTTTLYFIAPKELLNDKYPEAVHSEISVEYPTHKPEACASRVMITPTRKCGDNDYEDYDWFDIDLPLEHIEALINLGNQK